MSNAVINDITLKILEIPEDSATPDSVVTVTLKKGKLANTNPTYYQGIMRWKDEDTGKVSKIDMVQAVFSKQGHTGDQGRVALKIHLKGGNKFNQTTPVSKVPVPNPTPEEQKLHCIEIDSVGGSDLTLSFLEPAEGEVVTYPVVYFLTDQGIIDPGLGAIRIPP